MAASESASVATIPATVAAPQIEHSYRPAAAIVERPSDVAASSSTAEGPATRAVDGDDTTGWEGAPGDAQWWWRKTFAAPAHLGLIRAKLGRSVSEGVPTRYRWESIAPTNGACGGIDERAWSPIDATSEDASIGAPSSAVELPRRSWFVDVDACAVRLVVERTNVGAPVVRKVEMLESARDVLRDGVASDDGALPGFPASNAIDSAYATRWVGAPAQATWTLVTRLREPTTIDRVRIVLGADATSYPRTGPDAGIGRSYAIASAPLRYELEATDDDVHWRPLATTPLRHDRTPLPLRRRLVRLDSPRTVRAIRLVMHGATDATGHADPRAMPMVRQLSAYRADDPRPLLLPPWVLSINANPSAQTHGLNGGEDNNDIYFAKFLQERLSSVMPRLSRDDRFARAMGPGGQRREPGRSDDDGESLESIEGDDELLDSDFLTMSSPPPIAILSGSNDWDYAPWTRRTHTRSGPRWQWDPLLPARLGGMGQLARVVKERSSPLIGFCGGAQILALLEGKPDASDAVGVDQRTVDSIVRRTTGRPVRWFSSPNAVERSWPGEADAREAISFDPRDELFADLAGADERTVSHAFPESHADAIRPDAFLPFGPLAHMEIVATSDFCGEQVVDGGPRDRAFPNPEGPGACVTTPEVFRSRDGAWPVVGVQSHAERPIEFANAADGDPAESVADPLLFAAALYEEMVDAYVRNARSSSAPLTPSPPSTVARSAATHHPQRTSLRTDR